MDEERSSHRFCLPLAVGNEMGKTKPGSYCTDPYYLPPKAVAHEPTKELTACC